VVLSHLVYYFLQAKYLKTYLTLFRPSLTKSFKFFGTLKAYYSFVLKVPTTFICLSTKYKTNHRTVLRAFSHSRNFLSLVKAFSALWNQFLNIQYFRHNLWTLWKFAQTLRLKSVTKDCQSKDFSSQFWTSESLQKLSDTVYVQLWVLLATLSTNHLDTHQQSSNISQSTTLKSQPSLLKQTFGWKLILPRLPELWEVWVSPINHLNGKKTYFFQSDGG
jgi:hypothetical protein